VDPKIYEMYYLELSPLGGRGPEIKVAKANAFRRYISSHVVIQPLSELFSRLIIHNFLQNINDSSGVIFHLRAHLGRGVLGCISTQSTSWR
jgi:hypothetical protein